MKYFGSTICMCCMMMSSVLSAQMTLQIISTPQLTPLFDDIYIAGSFNDWTPGDDNYKLTNTSGVYSIELSGIENGASIDFKFTRGEWPNVEGNAAGGYIEDRTLTFQNGQTAQLTIEGWEDIAGNHTVTPHVRIMDSNFFMPQLNRYRRIWIAFPVDYFTSDVSYPVIYMHDGQNVFDNATSFAGEWRVDETMALPGMQGCKQAIVVAIDNGGALRIDELSPWYNSQYNAGGEGDDYVDFIVHSLKPFVDENFRTLPGRQHTTISGSSLGGLISMHAITKYNEVFSRAGIFSPAFWFNPEIFDYVQVNPHSSDSKIYFVCGTSESESMVPMMEQMRDMILAADVLPANVGYLAVPGGQHNENFWANQFPAAHNFLAPCGITNLVEAENESIIKLFPNPVKDTVQLVIKGVRIDNVVFYDGQMKTVLTHSMNRGNTIDVSKLHSGTYHVRVDYTHPSGKEDHVIEKRIM